jgi:microcystin-dependent protein
MDVLFNLIGTTYGGDGRTTFALPDLRGRTPINHGQGTGLSSYPIGAWAGTETAHVTIASLPYHTHSADTSALRASAPGRATSASAGPQGPEVSALGQFQGAVAFPGVFENGVLYATDADPIGLRNATITGEPTLQYTGGSQPVGIVQPLLSINYIMALHGVAPTQS